MCVHMHRSTAAFYRMGHVAVRKERGALSSPLFVSQPLPFLRSVFLPYFSRNACYVEKNV